MGDFSVAIVVALLELVTEAIKISTSIKLSGYSCIFLIVKIYIKLKFLW